MPNLAGTSRSTITASRTGKPAAGPVFRSIYCKRTFGAVFKQIYRFRCPQLASRRPHFPEFSPSRPDFEKEKRKKKQWKILAKSRNLRFTVKSRCGTRDSNPGPSFCEVRILPLRYVLDTCKVQAVSQGTYAADGKSKKIKSVCPKNFLGQTANWSLDGRVPRTESSFVQWTVDSVRFSVRFSVAVRWLDSRVLEFFPKTRQHSAMAGGSGTLRCFGLPYTR